MQGLKHARLATPHLFCVNTSNNLYIVLHTAQIVNTALGDSYALRQITKL